MSNHHLPRYLKPAGWIKESAAYLLDFFFTAVLMIAIWAAFGRPVMYDAFKGGASEHAYNSLAVQAGYATWNENGGIDDFSIDTSKPDIEIYKQYTRAEEVVWKYFTVHVATEDEFCFVEGDGFESIFEKGSIGYVNDACKWFYDSFFKIGDEKDPNPYFGPAVGDDYTKMPSPSAEIQAKLDSPDDAVSCAAYKDLFDYVYGISNSSNAAFARGVAHFKAEPSVAAAQNQRSVAFYAMLYPSIIVSPLVFFFIIPLLSSDGQTLGKRIMHVAILNQYGYKAEKWRIALHAGLVTLPYFVFLIPFPLYSFMGFSLYMLIDYIFMVMQGNRQSLHALVAHTIAVNSQNSIWFASREAEDSYIATHPNSLAAKVRKEEEGVYTRDGRLAPKSVDIIREEQGILDMETLMQAKKTNGQGNKGE